jgi:chromosome segregation ATPase
MQAEKERIVSEGLDDLKLQAQSFDPPRELPEAKPIDWSGLETVLAHLEKASIEELKADDPKLAKVQEAYDKAGGDPALFKKLHDEWRKKQVNREQQIKGAGKQFEDRTDKFRSRLNEASSGAAKSQKDVSQLESQVNSAKTELQGLSDATTPLSGQQQARQKKLQRDLPPLELQLKNEQARLAALESNKTSIETLMESEKQRHEAVQDDDFAPPAIEPLQADLASVPVRNKYVMLTGQQPPG